MPDLPNSKVIKILSVEFLIPVIVFIFSLGALFNQIEATAGDVYDNTTEIRFNSEMIQKTEVRLGRMEAILERMSTQLDRVEEKVDNDG